MTRHGSVLITRIIHHTGTCTTGERRRRAKPSQALADGNRSSRRCDRVVELPLCSSGCSSHQAEPVTITCVSRGEAEASHNKWFPVRRGIKEETVPHARLSASPATRCSAVCPGVGGPYMGMDTMVGSDPIGGGLYFSTLISRRRMSSRSRGQP